MSERNTSTLQSLAHTAQLRASRNQQNPHFMFNALNSIAGLLSRRRVSEAETMTLNSRTSFAPHWRWIRRNEITLDEEIGLQSLYLDIEKVRFPDRLEVTLDLPDELKAALVPSLITQPLIENSIKHGARRSTAPVRISLEVIARNGRQLSVEDDGGNAEGW